MGTSTMLVMDGYDDCIAGICTRCGQPPIIIYDQVKVLEALVAGGRTKEEATEYFEFNMVNAWVGEDTPAFLEHYKEP